MSKRQVDPRILEVKARDILNRLKNVANNHERTFPSFLEAVLVFSGPGTIYDKLKPGQEEWMRWMDRDRIRGGRAIVAQVTAARLSVSQGRRIDVQAVTREDVRTSGPLFVYNGIPVENKMLRQALQTGTLKLPKEKVVIIDEVIEEGGITH